MKIAHFSLFAPTRSGLYEAAADMVKADCLAGHDARFVDVGLSNDGLPAKVGQTDKRGDFTLTTTDHADVRDADIIVAHTGIPDEWIVGTEAPIIWILHGRPRDCYLTERNSRGTEQTLSLFQRIASWPRIRRFITMWPQHFPYWQVGLPAEKLELIDSLPIDRARFTPDGPVREIPPAVRGQFNILISDAWRKDTDIFTMACGACLAAEEIPGLRVHLFSVDVDANSNAPPVCEWFFQRLRDLDALGEVHGRVDDMPEVYRSIDLLVSPHGIATRTIVEPLCCGTAVLAAEPCSLTPYTAQPHHPAAVAAQIVKVIRQIRDVGRVEYRHHLAEQVKPWLGKFDLDVFGPTMTAVYERVLAGECSPTGVRAGSASLPDPPDSPPL